MGALSIPAFWTTLDETLYAKRTFFLKRNVPGLITYIHNCQCRRWYGPGMEVDPAVVILQSMDWLAELTGSKN